MNFSILHIITRLDRGGTVDVLISLARAANKRGNRVKIITGLTDDGVEISKKNSDLDIIFVKNLKREIDPISDIVAFFKILYLIFKNKPTIVHTHTSKAGMLGRVGAKLANVPIIVHTPHGHVFYGYFSKLKSKLIIGIEKYLTPFADVLIGISEGEINETIDFGVATRKKFELIRTGIFFPECFFVNSISREKERKKFNLKENDIALAFIGRLELIKGIDILIDAFIDISQKNRELKLIVVGDGSLYESSREKIEYNNLSHRVIFTGWRDDIWNILKAIDISVIPSRMEGMGKSAIESIFMKRVVVASSVGGLKTIIEEEKFGILVSKLNRENLSKKIMEMVDKLPEYNEKNIDQVSIRKKYDNRYMVERTFNLYRKLLIKKVK